MNGSRHQPFQFPAPPVLSERRRGLACQLARPSLCVVIVSAALAIVGCHKQVLPPRPYLAFVVNNQSQSVTAVDLASMRVVATVPVAPLPVEAIRRPKTNEIYVASTSGKISVIDFPSLAVSDTINIGRSAGDTLFSPDGSFAYTLDSRGGQIVFLNCNTRKVVGRVKVFPELAHMTITPDGKTLIASDPINDLLYFISTDSQKVLGSLKVGKTPGPLVVSRDGTEAFVADTGEEKITAAEIPSRTVLAHIEMGTRPTGLVLKPDGGELFILSNEGSTMTIIDASHDNIEQVLPTGKGPVAAAFKRDSSIMYLATAADGFVTAFDINNRAVQGTLHVGVSPRALALTPDERFLTVADSTTGNLVILRTTPLSMITVVPVGSDPVDVIVPGWEWESRNP